MADQQRRDSDLETEIQLLLLDIRYLNSELLTAETIQCHSLRNVITNLLRVLIRRANEKLQQLQERQGSNWTTQTNKLINFTTTEKYQHSKYHRNILQNPWEKIFGIDRNLLKRKANWHQSTSNFWRLQKTDTIDCNHNQNQSIFNHNQNYIHAIKIDTQCI